MKLVNQPTTLHQVHVALLPRSQLADDTWLHALMSKLTLACNFPDESYYSIDA